METRRYVLAIGLSMLVLIGYMQFIAPQPVERPAPQPEAAASAPVAEKAPAASAKPKSAAVAKSIAVAAKSRDIIIETDVVKAVVSTAGGVITKWELKNYREGDKEEVGFMVFMGKLFGSEKKAEAPKKQRGNVELFTRYESLRPEDLVAPLTVTPVEKELRNLAAVEFRSSADSVRLDKDRTSQTLVLTYTGPAGIAIEKKLTFYHDQYKVDVEVSTKGLDGYALALGTDFGSRTRSARTLPAASASLRSWTGRPSRKSPTASCWNCSIPARSSGSDRRTSTLPRRFCTVSRAS